MAGHWVFGIGSRDVRDVMVAGELVVADRRIALVDQDKLSADGSVHAAGLWDRLAAIEPHPFDAVGSSR